MSTRMGEALDLADRPASAAIDALTPPPDPTQDAEPADVLSELLAADPDVGLDDEDEAAILTLHRTVKLKGIHERKVAALGKEITRLTKQLIERAVELGLLNAKGRIALGAVDNGEGFMVKPYEVRQTFPKYREDPETGQPYTRDQLIEALKAHGLARLVVETTEQYAWPGYVKERVEKWQQTAGQAGVQDEQGRYLDLDGELLDAEEARDPLADVLALPRWLRVLVEPVDISRLQFTTSRITSPAADTSDGEAQASAAPAQG